MMNPEINGKTVSINRIFDAPIELVWQTWTQPEMIKAWWGPKGFTNTIHKMDVQTGGEWHLTMHGPDGTDYDNKYSYIEVIPFKKIVLKEMAGSDFTSTVLFTPIGNKTEMVMSVEFESVEKLEFAVENYGADKGLKENMDKLETFISNFDNKALEKTRYITHTNKNQLEIQREFDANVALVWRAWTEPELLDQWWAPKPWKTITKSMDFREGGRWLYTMNGPAGEQHWCLADYITINPKSNYTAVDAFCDEHGNKNDNMPSTTWDITFKSNGKNTTVNIIATYPTTEAMETTIKMGFKEGFAMAHNNLDKVLAELK